MGVEYTKEQINNLLRHLIFHNVAILSSLYASKNALRSKKMPIWIQDPVEEMFVELIQDLQDALCPILDIAQKEYKDRLDRLTIIKDAQERAELIRKTQSFEECHCAGCEDNRNIAVKKFVTSKESNVKNVIKRTIKSKTKKNGRSRS